MPPVLQDERDKSLRDLMGLLALPSLWAGRDGESVVHITAQAISRILPVRLVLARWKPVATEAPAELLYIDGERCSKDQEATCRRFVEQCTGMGQLTDREVYEETPVGKVSVIRLFMGTGRHGGAMWFASNEEAFPSTHQVAFLRAAVTLATTGLNTARVVQERERANRAKDEFLAMLGHELRNPLAPIVTALHLLKRREGESLGREYGIIERQVGHLSRLVDDLLDVTRITRGKVQLKRSPVHLDDVVNDALESVSPLLEEKHHTVSVKFAPERPLVLADRSRLRQIVSNLLSNAAKYTAEDGHITVKSVVEQKYVDLTIQDNGSGIDAATLPKIFELFEQGDAALDRSRGGLGIGLALVKTLTELHGGSVKAHSEGLGKGSEFVVRLPIYLGELKPRDSVAPSAPSRTGDSSVRVMLVDDNEDALALMTSALRLEGFTVESASDPLRALEILRTFRPQVAVLDIGLPVIDGYELARWIRATDANGETQLIALTGYGQPTDRDRAVAAGFAHHLVKPVSVEGLIAGINRVTASEQE